MVWKIVPAHGGGGIAKLAGAEEVDEGAVVAFAGLEFDGVGTGAGELLEEALAAVGLAGEEGAAGGGMGGVEKDAAAGFGVGEVYEADGGEGLLAFVADDDADEVVAAGGDAQDAVAGGGDEVGEEEGDGAAADDAVEVAQGGGEVGAGEAGRALRISEMTRRTWVGPSRGMCFQRGRRRG